jgi:hypothetical protein
MDTSLRGCVVIADKIINTVMPMKIGIQTSSRRKPGTRIFTDKTGFPRIKYGAGSKSRFAGM